MGILSGKPTWVSLGEKIEPRSPPEGSLADRDTEEERLAEWPRCHHDDLMCLLITKGAGESAGLSSLGKWKHQKVPVSAFSL